ADIVTFSETSGGQIGSSTSESGDREITLPEAAGRKPISQSKHADRAMPLKIMQGAHSGDDRGKRGGNLRVRGVCIVILSVHQVPVNRSMESFRDLHRRAAELDDHSTAAHAVYAEPVGSKPSCGL